MWALLPNSGVGGTGAGASVAMIKLGGTWLGVETSHSSGAPWQLPVGARPDLLVSSPFLPVSMWLLL